VLVKEEGKGEEKKFARCVVQGGTRGALKRVESEDVLGWKRVKDKFVGKW
jgi:hypothetical protein